MHTALGPSLAVLVAVAALGAASCDRTEGKQETIPGLPAPELRYAVLPASADLVRQLNCSGWRLEDTIGFAPDSRVTAALDARVVTSAESLFAVLRQQERFRHLSPATSYIRQYVGIERPSGRHVYVHAVDPRILEQFPGLTLSWTSLQQDPLRACDAGSAVWGLFVDLSSGAIGKLQFSHSFGGPYTYED